MTIAQPATPNGVWSQLGIIADTTLTGAPLKVSSPRPGPRRDAHPCLWPAGGGDSHQKRRSGMRTVSPGNTGVVLVSAYCRSAISLACLIKTRLVSAR